MSRHTPRLHLCCCSKSFRRKRLGQWIREVRVLSKDSAESSGWRQWKQYLNAGIQRFDPGKMDLENGTEHRREMARQVHEHVHLTRIDMRPDPDMQASKQTDGRTPGLDRLRPLAGKHWSNAGPSDHNSASEREWHIKPNLLCPGGVSCRRCIGMPPRVLAQFWIPGDTDWQVSGRWSGPLQTNVVTRLEN